VNRVGGVAENLIGIRERIAAAAERAGRRPEEIRLVAVTKTQPVERIREAIEAGATEIGENYVQEAEAKLAQLEGRFTRHLIGHLQRNKAGKAAALFDLVHTVDSVELAEALGRRAAGLGRTLDVLIEVNAAGEASKTGVAPERAPELAEGVAGVPGLRLCGVMGMGPLTDDERAVRRCFQQLHRIYNDFPEAHRQVLSMGMSGDFELAIVEGSNLVRIGTGIFGARRS
jgi:PLP dependent protein